MRQRVAFLRTLLAGKPVLALDEPFARSTRSRAPRCRRGWPGTLVREPRTVVLVTHDVEEAIVLADRVAVLSPRPGRVVAELRWTSPRPRVAHGPRGGRRARARARRPSPQRWPTASSAERRTAVAQVGTREGGGLLRPAWGPAGAVRGYGRCRPGGAGRVEIFTSGRPTSCSPPPHSVAAALWDGGGFLAANLEPTAEEVGLGILLALLLGFVLAVLIHLSRSLRRAVYPLAVGSQAVPIPVIGALPVFWWGFGDLLLVVTVLICFLPVLVTTVIWPRRRRTPTSHAAAHPRRALAGFPVRRAPAALPAAFEAGADRARGRGHRRLHRRASDGDQRGPSGARREINR